MLVVTKERILTSRIRVVSVILVTKISIVHYSYPRILFISSWNSCMHHLIQIMLLILLFPDTIFVVQKLIYDMSFLAYTIFHYHIG